MTTEKRIYTLFGKAVLENMPLNHLEVLIIDAVRAAVKEALDRQRKELHEFYLVSKKVTVLEAIQAERVAIKKALRLLDLVLSNTDPVNEPDKVEDPVYWAYKILDQAFWARSEEKQ